MKHIPLHPHNPSTVVVSDHAKHAWAIYDTFAGGRVGSIFWI